MAIYRVSGQMLQSTLVRDGNNIAFANTASSTSTLFVDIVNNRVGVNSNVANVTLDVQGNIFALNLSSTGNITASNVNGTVLSATANITGGNVLTVGLITATGNITGGNILTVGQVSATANITGGNISATGNVQGGNLLSTGVVSVTGNVRGGNVNTNGNVTAGNVKVGNILIPSTGNVLLANVNINYLAEPSADSDAATKLYVDNTVGNVVNIGNLTVSNTTIDSLNSDLVAFGGVSGIIIPSGNIDQRPAPATVATIRFNTTNTALEIWDGSNWVSGSGDVSVLTNQTLNGDGSTTVFALDQQATAESILVSINGVLQTPVVDYTTSTGPNEITFTTAPAEGDVVQIRFVSTTTTVAALYNGTTNINIPASNGNVVVSVGGVSNVVTVTNTGVVVSGVVKTIPTTVGSLPSAATVGAGARAFVTDANTTTFYSNVGSGGSNNVPVFSNGTTWLVG